MTKMVEFEPGYFVDTFGIIWKRQSNTKMTRVRIGRSSKYPAFCTLGKQKYVHRVVASAFIPNPDRKPCVNHINGDPTDNRVENLEWCTYAENNQHSYDSGLKIGAALGKFGEDNPSSKPVAMVTMDGEVVRIFAGLHEAERETGISKSNICAVCRGYKWKRSAGGYKWEYKNAET